MPSAVLGGPIPNPKPTPEQETTAAAVVAELLAAQKAYTANNSDKNKTALDSALAKYKALPDLYHARIYGGRSRKTRGGACGVSKDTMSELGLVYMGYCVWQRYDFKALSHVPKGFTKTTLHGKPAYIKNPGGGRKTRRRSTRRGARASRKRPTR